MTAAAEHALRTLGEKLEEAGQGIPDMSGGYVLKAMADAHIATADQLERERKDREAQLAENASQFRYDPKAKRAQRG